MYNKHPRSQCGWSRESEGKVAKMVFRGITDQQLFSELLLFAHQCANLVGDGAVREPLKTTKHSPYKKKIISIPHLAA